ncbi:unnamed protein product [Effrenium voratum]|uniref:ABC transporter domain-containing protein n=1 Tax=Effrenium voratum TaxID=2562239 RepID=A0AA36NEQ9_9DINO|nr:unnamed protein product [Effrenium voratum]
MALDEEAKGEAEGEQSPQDGQLQAFLRQISQRPLGSKRNFSMLCAQPATLEWDFSVMANQKHILSRMSGRARPGEVCCILGGSGAGKSTLLNVLAGRQLTSRVFRIEGELRVNGRAVEPWRLRPRVAYVMQKDEFFATETPREAILFSARLRLPASHLSMLEEKGIDSYITQLLDSLGLSGCCDRRIGGASLNGISNGERKRVSIGVELITRPSIVFLDEPTTGLDSFSAWQVMRIVKDLADSGCTVVCTIHQPSSEIFALLDRVICLCHQRAIYHGPATELSRWLERSGRHVPRDYNPADYVMFLMETLPKSELELLCGTSRVSRDSSFRPSADGGSAPHRLEPAKMRKSFALQVWCLTQREWRNLRRDSASLKLRFVLTGFLTILFSLVFCNVGEHPVLAQLRRGGPWQALLSHPRLRRLQRLVNTQQVPLLQQLQQEIEYHYKVGFTAMFSASQPTILSFPLERPVFLREYSSNMYGTLAYFLSKMLVEAPLGALQALLALSISHHYMRFQGEFLEMWATVCLLNACAVSFSLLIGCLVRYPRESGAIGPLVFVPQLLMSGTFIPVQAIPHFLRWMQYVSFLQYAVKLLAIVEFRRTDPLLQRLIFRTMEVDPDLAKVYVATLLLMCVGFALVAIKLLSGKAHSVY